MNLLINVVMAWLTVVLMVLLLVIYLLRLLIKKLAIPKASWVRRLNRRLRGSHKWLGLMALVTGLIHGLYSSVPVLTKNKGSVLWVLFVLLGLTFVFRKPLKAWRPWLHLHRVLALGTLIFLFLHLLEVNWFVGIDPIINAVKRDLFVASEITVIEQTDEEDQVEVLEEVAATNKTMAQLLVLSDGTYRGEAIAYQPGLVVEVIVENHQIVAIDIIQHYEVNEVFWGEPMVKIPLSIIESQSTEVDIISGATYTSYGIMDAVDDALSGGQLSLGKEEEIDESDTEILLEIEEAEEPMNEEVELSEAKEQEETSGEILADTDEKVETVDPSVSTDGLIAEAEATNESEVEVEVEAQEGPELVEESLEVDKTDTTSQEDGMVDGDEENTGDPSEIVEVPTYLYNDGVYVGTANGYRPGLTVEVQVINDQIISVNVIDHNEKNERYWGKPVNQIPAAIVEAQSTEVDIVSGATYTSRGIMRAVENALLKGLK